MSQIKGGGVKKFHHTYPIGSVKNGRVKIQTKDGKTKWVSVRAGLFAGGSGGAGVSVKTTADYTGGNSNNEGFLQ